MLAKYVHRMGGYLQHIRIECPSPNLLTAYGVAQCVETLLLGLTYLDQGRTTVQSFHMSDLHFDETWGCFKSSKCLLVDSVSSFTEAQTRLRLFDMSDAFMTPPFANRIMRAVKNSKSTKTLERLNIVNFYSLEAMRRSTSRQLRSLFKKFWCLREISINYSCLSWVGLVNVCELLDNTLQKLNIHLTIFDYSREWDIIKSDDWKLATGLCPDLDVSLHMVGWPEDPTGYLTPCMPLAHLSVTGGQCRYSHTTYGDKTSSMLRHLARYFSASLKSVSFVAHCVSTPSPDKDTLAKLLVSCRNVRSMVFSDTLVTPELISEVENKLSDTKGDVSIVKI